MYLCLKCGAETSHDDPRISDEQHPNHGGCPECGSTGIPADTDARLTVSITWHELRVLVIWAERWASASAEKENNREQLDVVYGIAGRIQEQHMDQECGLTFRSELAELSAMGFKVAQNVIAEDAGITPREQL